MCKKNKQKKQLLSNRICGGHGRCECGSCVCDNDWTGEDCSCSLEVASCMASNQMLCGGRGICMCGTCKCEPPYSGPTCEDCPTCRGVCQEYRECVECRAFGTGRKKEWWARVSFKARWWIKCLGTNLGLNCIHLPHELWHQMHQERIRWCFFELTALSHSSSGVTENVPTSRWTWWTPNTIWLNVAQCGAEMTIVFFTTPSPRRPLEDSWL